MRDLYCVILSVLAVYISSHGTDAQIPLYVVRVKNLLEMQQGIGWPLRLDVVKGHEAMLRLSSTLENMEECKVFTPAGVHFEVRQPPDNRYQYFGQDCGVRIKNVTNADHGRWRLVASKGNESIVGWSEINIVDDVPPYIPPESITLQEGKTHADVELTSLDSSYCLVTQPFSESSFVAGHCRMTLDRTTRAVQGRWNVVVGVPGRVSEVQVERDVAVKTEQLVSGYKEEAAKLSLYCNIAHTEKNLTFCRFQKNSASSGYNIIDGLSDGYHSYYGGGFLNRECGMTIESPSTEDYGTWRCTVGMQEWKDKKIVQSTPMQALIRVAPKENKLFSFFHETANSEDESRVLMVQKDNSLMIMCKAEMSLAYCWFQHPNGTQFTPVERQTEEEHDFWYTGESLQIGECGITFAHVSENDVGEWTCHMGPRNHLGVEVTEKVLVRLTGPIAAVKQEVTTNIGEEVTLHCQTSNGPTPLDYCRFVTPNSVGISIDSSVTQENALLGRFYFTPEKSLDYGDCSLTINPVQIEDIGQWTCAGLVHDQAQEARDTIEVLHTFTKSTRNPARQATIAGTTIGIAGLAVLLAGVLWYKKGKPIPWRIHFRNSDAVSLSLSTPRSSGDSREIQIQPVY